MFNHTKKYVFIAVLFLLISSIVIVFTTRRKEPVALLQLKLERFVPADSPVVLRIDNIKDLWPGFEGTRFYAEFSNYCARVFEDIPHTQISPAMDFFNAVIDFFSGNSRARIIPDLLGNNVLFAYWPDTELKSYIFLSSPVKDSESEKQLSKSYASAKKYSSYKGIKLLRFEGNKYWFVKEGVLFVSNDMSISRKIIDLFEDDSSSLSRDAGFLNAVSVSKHSNYLYMRGGSRGVGKTAVEHISPWEFPDNILAAFSFESGIRCDIYFYGSGKVSAKNIRIPAIAATDALMFASGNFTGLFFDEYGEVGSRLIFGKKSGYILLPYKNDFAGLVYCQVKDKEVFMEYFKKLTNENSISDEDGFLTYNFPFLGEKKCKYLFLDDYFVIYSPPDMEISYAFDSMLHPTQNITIDGVKIPRRICGLYYMNTSGILSVFLKNNIFDFIMPVSGYTIRRKNYFKTEFYCGLKDLSSGDWKNRISYISSITNKKINAIKERVTMENLKILRNAVSMYNAGTGMYPENLPALIPEYISEIPKEEIMKSSNTLSVINGTGGWFYKDGWVFLNLNGKDSRGYFYSNW